MERQGHVGETGWTKITPAFNPPCHYVIHAVGHIVEDKPAAEDRAYLASCYRACMELAARNNVRSLAFCCLATGVFRFPNEEAADIAVRTVRAIRPDSMEVIFTVFKQEDHDMYRRLLGGR